MGGALIQRAADREQCAEAGQISKKPSVPCTYPQCSERFDSVSAMKRHKIATVEHEYCEKCDKDCDDYESLILHKVQAMAPWLEGPEDERNQKLTKHIVCEFCGKDFASFGGRRLHVSQQHPAAQRITCPEKECGAIFKSAGSYIEHFEHNACNGDVSSAKFYDQIQRKHVLSHIWKFPDRFTKNIQKTLGGQPQEPPPPLPGRQSSVKSLQTAGDEGFSSGWPDSDLAAEKSAGQYWPALSPTSDGKEIDECFDRLSVGSPSRPGVNTPTKDRVTDNAGDSPPHTMAKKLSKGQASACPPVGTDKPIIPQPEPVNIIRDTRFWDPKSAEFQPQFFIDAVTGLYLCPLADCTGSYQTLDALAVHLDITHIQVHFICPSCNKRFPRPSRLVFHLESGTRCGVRHHRNLGATVELVSGGYLDVREFHSPKIFWHGKSKLRSGNSGERVNGVMKLEFAAKQPRDAVSEVWAKKS